MLFESRHVGAGIAKHEWSHVQFRSVAAGHLIADCDRGVPIFFGSSYVSIGKPVDMGSVYVGPTGGESFTCSPLSTLRRLPRSRRYRYQIAALEHHGS